MEMIIDVLGWLAGFMIVGAYWGISTHRFKANDLAYQMLNLVGSILLVINTLYYGALPSSFVNLIWAIIAIVALLKIKVKNKNE